LLVHKLKYATITWVQPWYQLSQCLTRPLKELHENGECFETGTFNIDEVTTIEKNWSDFVKVL
jgi:hypothetical protein